MSQLSNYAEKLVLDFLMTTGAVVRPTSWYMALCTSATNDAGAGTEVAGNGYVRQSISFGAASSPDGTIANTNLVTFTASGGDWGTVTHAKIMDAETDGNMLWHGPLEDQRLMLNGDYLDFAIGTINLTMG